MYTTSSENNVRNRHTHTNAQHYNTTHHTAPRHNARTRAHAQANTQHTQNENAIATRQTWRKTQCPHYQFAISKCVKSLTELYEDSIGKRVDKTHNTHTTTHTTTHKHKKKHTHTHTHTQQHIHTQARAHTKIMHTQNHTQTPTNTHNTQQTTH